jgi:L-alanine-DL-glutamate epimerase-like enolase superfamily enzyme
MLRSLAAARLSIPFRLSFKHASASRSATQALWVAAEAGGGARGFGEGCPREYVTGETLEGAQAFVAAHTAAWLREIRDLASLRHWVDRHRAAIDENPAAWTAVELAILDAFGKAQGRTLESLLGLPGLQGSFRYTAVLGDAEPAVFEAQLARYRQAGFRQFKIKLAGDAGRDAAKARALEAAGIPPDAVRADANNLWRSPEAAIDALRALRFPFFALEEPLQAADYAGMARVAQAVGADIVLDESLARPGQLDALPGPAARWLPNLRVSKMGGVLRSLEFLEAAKRRGLRVIVGAHVGETSVLARAALTVASAAGEALAAQEGAFGTHLLERDVAEPPLMFGAGGVLDPLAHGCAALPGLGLRIHEAA